MADKLKLSPPWLTYLHEVEALFGDDPNVQVVYNSGDDGPSIDLFVHGAAKADALTQLLPATKTFGNIVMKIRVIPANDVQAPSKIDLMRTAFDGNPALSYIASVTDIYPINYVVFKPKVVQFYNDQLNDPNGYVSTLYQNVAQDVFADTDVSGIYFCTDVVKD